LSTFSTNFNDNTYGPNKQTDWGAITHTFKKLTGSDHLRLDIKDADGITFFDAKIDYISKENEPGTTNSGYTTGGVSFGDDKIYTGDASMISGVRTSLSENINTPTSSGGCFDSSNPNRYGTVPSEDDNDSSPPVDEDYDQQDPSDPLYCLNWDFSVWFEITIDAAAIPVDGFGYPSVTSIHASPSKLTIGNTLQVQPGPDPSLPPYFDN